MWWNNDTVYKLYNRNYHIIWVSVTIQVTEVMKNETNNSGRTNYVTEQCVPNGVQEWGELFSCFTKIVLCSVINFHCFSLKSLQKVSTCIVVCMFTFSSCIALPCKINKFKSVTYIRSWHAKLQILMYSLYSKLGQRLTKVVIPAFVLRIDVLVLALFVPLALLSFVLNSLVLHLSMKQK